MSLSLNATQLSTLQTNLALLQTQLATTSVAAGTLSTQYTTFNTGLGNSTITVNAIDLPGVNEVVLAWIAEATVMATLITQITTDLQKHP